MAGLIAVGVSKQLIVAKETTFATPAAAGTGQLMRRTSSNVDLSKKTYKSTEIRPDYQFSDFRHGTRSVTGTISDELSVGTWQMFMASVMRQAWQKAGATAATSIDAVAGTATDPADHPRSRLVHHGRLHDRRRRAVRRLHGRHGEQREQLFHHGDHRAGAERHLP